MVGLNLQLEVLPRRPDRAGYKRVFSKCYFTVSSLSKRAEEPQ